MFSWRGGEWDEASRPVVGTPPASCHSAGLRLESVQVTEMSPGNGLILRSNFERLGLAVFLIAMVVGLSFCRGADKGPVRTLEAGVEIVENGAGGG